MGRVLKLKSTLVYRDEGEQSYGKLTVAPSPVNEHDERVAPLVRLRTPSSVQQRAPTTNANAAAL